MMIGEDGFYLGSSGVYGYFVRISTADYVFQLLWNRSAFYLYPFCMYCWPGFSLPSQSLVSLAAMFSTCFFSYNTFFFSIYFLLICMSGFGLHLLADIVLLLFLPFFLIPFLPWRLLLYEYKSTLPLLYCTAGLVAANFRFCLF